MQTEQLDTDNDLRDQISDAMELMDYAVETGVTFPKRILEDITSAGHLLDQKSTISIEKKVNFTKAYRDLANILNPVTINTLRATDDEYGEIRRLLLLFKPGSQARIMSRKLCLWTMIVVLLTLLGENLHSILLGYYPVDEESTSGILTFYKINSVYQNILPFFYGAMGALTFLLRSCHEHIRNREFDMNRMPEYISRIILGVVAGGTVALFVQEMADDTGTVVQLSASALGFLAGYNNDFLFKAIERVSAAIMPKVGLESVRQRQTQQGIQNMQDVLQPLSVEKLLEIHDATKDDDTKKMIKQLIENLSEEK